MFCPWRLSRRGWVRPSSSCGCTYLLQGSWTRWPLKVPSSSKDSMILRQQASLLLPRNTDISLHSHCNAMAFLKSSILSKQHRSWRCHITSEKQIGELQEERKYQRQKPPPRGCCSSALLPGPLHSVTLISPRNTIRLFNLKGGMGYGLMMGLGSSGWLPDLMTSRRSFLT